MTTNNDYKPLTKLIKDDCGNEIIVCQLFGTSQCRNIHKPNECNLICPMVKAMMTQLHVFEEVYTSALGGIDDKC